MWASHRVQPLHPAGIAADKATTGYTHVVLEESPRLYCHVLANGRRRDSWALVSAAAGALADGALRAQQCIAGEAACLWREQYVLGWLFSGTSFLI